MNKLRNVKTLSDISAVQVSAHAVFQLLRSSEFSHLEVLLMQRHLSDFRERAAHPGVLSPVKIVDIEILDVREGLVVQVVTDWGVVVLQVNRVPVENAVVCIYLVHDLLRDHAPRSD